MLLYPIKIDANMLLIKDIKDTIIEFRWNFINDCWLQGQIINILDETILESDTNLDITYNIYYEIFEDKDYIEEKERLEIGL